MAQLDPTSHSYQSIQPLRGGISRGITLITGNVGIATVVSPVTIQGGNESVVTTSVRKVGSGVTSVTAMQPPGHVPATNLVYEFNPMPTIQVTVN
jgi:hypothetical protein